MTLKEAHHNPLMLRLPMDSLPRNAPLQVSAGALRFLRPKVRPRCNKKNSASWQYKTSIKSPQQEYIPTVGILNTKSLTLAIVICFCLWQAHWESVSRRAFGSGDRWLHWTAICNYAVLILMILMLVPYAAFTLKRQRCRACSANLQDLRKTWPVVQGRSKDVQAKSTQSILPVWLQRIIRLEEYMQDSIHKTSTVLVYLLLAR